MTSSWIYWWNSLSSSVGLEGESFYFSITWEKSDAFGTWLPLSTRYREGSKSALCLLYRYCLRPALLLCTCDSHS